jgi:hypothetical protein
VRTENRAQTLIAGITAVTVILGLPGCGVGDVGSVSPPPPPTTTTTLPAPSPSPPHVGIWLQKGGLSGQWPLQHKGDCIVADIQPNILASKLASAPSAIHWTIYNNCPTAWLVRISPKGPKSPFQPGTCPQIPQIALGLPFRVPASPAPPTDVTCALIPNPCAHFAFQVEPLPPAPQPQNCVISTGQIEIDPW